MRPAGGWATAAAAVVAAHVALGVAWLTLSRVSLPPPAVRQAGGDAPAASVGGGGGGVPWTPLPAATGPTGTISSTLRFIDAVSTLVAPVAVGRMPLGTIYRSPADNYLTSIYKDVFNDVGLSRHPCLQDGGPVCGIAPSHPAISGIVHFSFETPHTNMRGSSVQTQLACQCMSSDCTNIATVAIRRPPSGRAFSIDGDNGSCTYQQVVPTSEGGAAAAAAVGGPPTLHSCASALMHIDAVRGEPVGPFPQEQFVYNVTRFGRNSWSANGYRNGFEKEPSPPPLLPNASAVAVTEPSPAAATATLPRFTPVTTADGPHAEVCGALGSTLGLAAAFHASAQDAAATGSDYDSFLDEPPVLLSDTDIAMTVCGAILGVVAVLSLFRATWSMQKLRWMPKLLSKYIPRGRRDDLNHDLAVAQAAVICFGLVLFGLETSALHVALVSEIAAARWRGAFVHLDLTLVSRGPTDVLAFSNLDASGILFIATSLIGVAQYQSTRQTITFVLVVVLDVIVLAAVAVQVVHWVVSARRVDAAVAASPNDSQGGGGYDREEAEWKPSGSGSSAAVKLLD